MKTGIELIAQERQEQLTKHNRSIESDIRNNAKGELLKTADTLIKGGNGVYPANWDFNYCVKLNHLTQKRKLIIAGALIAAEIDRLQAIED